MAPRRRPLLFAYLPRQRRQAYVRHSTACFGVDSLRSFASEYYQHLVSYSCAFVFLLQ